MSPPEMGRQRQKDPWSILDSSLVDLASSRPVRDCFNKTWCSSGNITEVGAEEIKEPEDGDMRRKRHLSEMKSRLCSRECCSCGLLHFNNLSWMKEGWVHDAPPLPKSYW